MLIALGAVWAVLIAQEYKGMTDVSPALTFSALREINGDNCLGHIITFEDKEIISTTSIREYVCGRKDAHGGFLNIGRSESDIPPNVVLE